MAKIKNQLPIFERKEIVRKTFYEQYQELTIIEKIYMKYTSKFFFPSWSFSNCFFNNTIKYAKGSLRNWADMDRKITVKKRKKLLVNNYQSKIYY